MSVPFLNQLRRAPLRLHTVLLLCSLAVCITAPAQAEGNDGMIAGVVIDSNGAPLDSATVKARDGRGHTISARTDENGSFRIRHLATGPYSLMVFAKNHTPFRYGAVEVNNERIATAMVQLDSTFIELEELPPMLQTGSSEVVGLSIDSSTIERLPL